MSLSYSDCNSDLLCGEDSGILSGEYQPECSSDFDYCPDFDDSIAEFIEQERKFVPGIDYVELFQSHVLDASAREESVAWILKVQRFYGFQPLTAYLAVNYLDRFIYCRGLPMANGWPLQLLSVACLSLAAKMEEPIVPSLLDIQIEGAKYIFESKTIRRMEFLVLGVLDWRLRSVTPFSFIGFFAHKIDPSGTYTGFLISRSTQIILSNIQEANLLEYWPSCIAAAIILCAASDLSNFSLINAEQAECWCDGLSKEKITKCYRLVQGVSPLERSKTQIRFMTRMSTGSGPGSGSGDWSSASSSSSPSTYKRRKLNNLSWVDDDKSSSSN
ncbi:cyclin-D1-1-like [Rutidosis leptorrhynchoides]|uniref:cyclin-D1-1-like n=1 Tax=Rutidosis leptorrhynchoides TaxID=125765 RepID=UPI003A99A17C